nr:hypothetical protein Iba_scaffold15400CG0170 [Ipomoea batatas]
MKTLLYLCMMTLLTMKRTLGKGLSSIALMVKMFIMEFLRTTQGMMLLLTTFLLLSSGTNLQLRVAAGRLWIAVQMITSLFTTLIMVVLVCSVCLPVLISMLMS